MKSKIILSLALFGALTGTSLSLFAKDETWSETLTNTDQTFSNHGRNPFFILEPGYQLVLKGKEDGEKVVLTITVLDETKTVDGVETRIVEERETSGGKLKEVSRNYFAMGKETGTIYYFGEDVDVYEKGKVVHEGSWLSGVDGAKYGILMPGKIVVGQKYYQERAPKVAMDRGENISTDESAETPKGVAQHCLRVKETTPLEAGTEYKIYAPEIGLVVEGGLKLVKAGFVKK